MLNKWISSVVFAFVLLSNTQTIVAQNLPDFTDLAEKHGQEVVNISVTQIAQGNPNGSMPFPLPPGMPNDEAIQEFFKRFGIPGMPGQPGGPGGPAGRPGRPTVGPGPRQVVGPTEKPAEGVAADGPKGPVVKRVRKAEVPVATAAKGE